MNNERDETNSTGPIRWGMNTILGGIVIVFPFLAIAAIVHYLFTLLTTYLVQPFADLLLPEQYDRTLWYFGAPLLSIVLAFLFLMGLVFRTRVRRSIDWAMHRVPGVTTIYAALQDTVEALRGPPGIENVDTVVLVPFPQKGMRMAGYLMTRNKQPDGNDLLSVYIPIVLFPPSGYTVLVPESDVVFTDWPTKDVWKLLMSGGLTLPPEIPFEPEEGVKQGGKTSGKPADDQT
ncbi:hypothetical protein KOR42_06530 [Thalassoglobus neptunius]|uniref:DUF502 domain-containing protein n=1 Tax=Thalassoglobus neptunius TaxID=1938619 RepID=A0A5C5X2E6_9PLAN|nr:DUF502 domain-containing protein [Thalassoglobus neptunius]TWT57294.1 hypothetical protein KOR42_06530 [Thalassoglobus neptunius]